VSRVSSLVGFVSRLNINIYIHTYIHTYMYIYLPISKCVCVCVCVYVCVYIYTHTYVYVYIYMYTHTHTRTHTHTHTYIAEKRREERRAEKELFRVRKCGKCNQEYSNDKNRGGQCVHKGRSHLLCGRSLLTLKRQKPRRAVHSQRRADLLLKGTVKETY
jgi:hypothetical protein